MNGAITDASAFGINVSEEGTPSYVHTGNLAYTNSFKNQNMNATIGSNVNNTSFLDEQSLFIGPSITIQKKFKNKMSLSGGSTYNRQYKNALLVGNVFNHRISANYTIKMKNEKQGSLNFSINGNWMAKLPTVTSETALNELNIFINLGYRF